MGRDSQFLGRDKRLETESITTKPSGKTLLPSLSEGYHNILAAKRSRTSRQPQDRGPKSLTQHTDPAQGVHRWVVERTLSWLHQFRRLRVRYERRADIHEAFMALGCVIMCWRTLQNEFCQTVLDISFRLLRFSADDIGTIPLEVLIFAEDEIQRRP